MENRVQYATQQTVNRTFICIKISLVDLNIIKSILPVDIVINDLGKNGYLIDFVNNKTTLKILTIINNGPIGKAPILPVSI